MNVQVLSIEPANETRKFNVVVLVGNEQHKLTVKVETDIIGERELLLINGDADCWNLFKFNQNLDTMVCKLVGKVYNNEVVELPVYIGQFYPRSIEPVSVQKQL